MKKLFVLLVLLSIPLILTAQQTYIPDDNFEQALIDLGHDTPPLNDSITTANILSIKVLDVSNKNISDLTAIEDFTSLEDLNCQFNSLTSLNVSYNTKLYNLNCFENQLDILDVSNLTSLQYLLCYNNKLTKIILGENHPEFISLNCRGNKLISLDVSKQTGLLWLLCSGNEISTLDVSLNTLLRNLDCSNNKLIELNVKNGNNANMRKMGTLKGMDARNNSNLTCIQVDNQTASENNSDWAKDALAVYSEDCGNIDVMENHKETDVNIYPNPADDIISLAGINDNIKIFDVMGREVWRGLIKDEQRISVCDFNTGIYYIKAEGEMQTKKFVIMR